MADQKIERQTITTTQTPRDETVERVHVSGTRDHGDPEAGGAVAGGVAGAAVGAVVGGPVGAVVGGAIGAATGATAGLAKEETKNDDVVIERETRRP